MTWTTEPKTDATAASRKPSLKAVLIGIGVGILVINLSVHFATLTFDALSTRAEERHELQTTRTALVDASSETWKTLDTEPLLAVEYTSHSEVRSTGGFILRDQYTVLVDAVRFTVSDSVGSLHSKTVAQTATAFVELPPAPAESTPNSPYVETQACVRTAPTAAEQAQLVELHVDTCGTRYLLHVKASDLPGALSQ